MLCMWKWILLNRKLIFCHFEKSIVFTGQKISSTFCHEQAFNFFKLYQICICQKNLQL